MDNWWLDFVNCSRSVTALRWAYFTFCLLIIISKWSYYITLRNFWVTNDNQFIIILYILYTNNLEKINHKLKTDKLINSGSQRSCNRVLSSKNTHISSGVIASLDTWWPAAFITAAVYVCMFEFVEMYLANTSVQVRTYRLGHTMFLC